VNRCRLPSATCGPSPSVGSSIRPTVSEYAALGQSKMLRRIEDVSERGSGSVDGELRRLDSGLQGLGGRMRRPGAGTERIKEDTTRFYYELHNIVQLVAENHNVDITVTFGGLVNC
jgi:phage tail tape-measure protein